MYVLSKYWFLLTALWFAGALTLPQPVYGDSVVPGGYGTVDPFAEFLWPRGLSTPLSAVTAAHGIYKLEEEVEDEETCMNGGVPVTGKGDVCQCAATNGFSGLSCELCQRDGVCSKRSRYANECNHSLVIRGTNKQFECALDSPFFVNLMGGGRDIEARVIFNCSTGNDDSFINGASGECSMDLFRIEPNEEYVDKFFRCISSPCSMQVSEESKNENDNYNSKLSKVFKGLMITGQVVLVTLCALLAMLRCISSKLGRHRTAKIVVGLGTTLVLSTLLFITIMFVSMRPKHSNMIVLYECKHTQCLCAKDPPAKYVPFCSKTVLNESILPNIKNSIKYVCNLQTKKCQLTLADLALVFDLNCTASECVDTKKYPATSTVEEPDTTQAQRNLLVILIIAITLLIVSIAAHAYWLSSRSKRKAIEFVRMFGLSESVPHSGSLREIDDEEKLKEKDEEKEENEEREQNNNNNNNNKRERNNNNDDDTNNNEENINQEEPQQPMRMDSKEEEENVTHRDDENVGFALRSQSHTTSDARRVITTMANEADQIEFVRKLAKSPFELKLTDLEYALTGSRFAIDEESRTRFILQQVNFTVHSGEVLAILGPSGAGKTTLLDLLSARSKQGRVLGSMSLNGTPVSTNSVASLKLYRNIIGYVSQEDTLLPALTVYQTIEYAARLKLPQAFSNSTIKGIVRRMIEALKLQRCEHTLIGDGSGLRGVSGGEKRRVSIAVELLANPRILFLDEPTSGLDAISAKRVIEAVVELAKESPMRAYAPHYFAFKPIVIFSIHQPSQEIFNLFDKLLLLSRGVSVYCGPANTAAETLESRVVRVLGNTRSIPRSMDHPNHAEYLMKLEEILDDTARMELQAEDVTQVAIIHENAESLQQQQQQPRENYNRQYFTENESLVAGEDILRTAAAFRVYYANVYQQFMLLTSRAASCLVSSFHLVVCHAAVTAFVGVLMMFLYREQNLDLPGALNRAGSITFLLLVVSFVSLSSLEQLIAERKLFVVERENGFYRTLPYLLSKILVDIVPLRIVPAMVLASLIYFPMGLRVDDGVHFFWFIVVVILFSVCITLVVLCIGILTGSFGAAALLSSVVILWNFVFGGFLVQSETVPKALHPFQAISPFFLTFEALLVNELDGQACTFAPTDETGKPAANSIPIMCVQYLSNIGLKPARFNGDVAQLALLILLLFALAWVLLAKFTTIVR
ncbi:ABC transporter [Trypanosoma theileri]|uniref:ABC transporter n=1 Tax=Trypanosoma theileri TaxID=67003 RepID=A0A1X0NX42_9TRYP|nr:ABC transporter [Trypanosoma theileri]ORC89274.1 ABC transporter [Trypanosoma theileri]